MAGCALTERSRYDDVSSLYVNQLAYVWMEDSTTETTRTSFEKQIDSFVKGELEHATQILSALWEVVNKDGDITAPPNSSPAVSPSHPCLLPSWVGTLTSHNQVAQVTSPAHWATVKLALIRSISKGVFFDRKYWARHSNAGDVLKPVYFSSIIMGDKVQQLNGCASKSVYVSIAALRVVSGNISQESESYNLLRGRCQHRQ